MGPEEGIAVTCSPRADAGVSPNALLWVTAGLQREDKSLMQPCPGDDRGRKDPSLRSLGMI